VTLCGTGSMYLRAANTYFGSNIMLNWRVTDMTGPLKKQESKHSENVDKVRKNWDRRFVDMQEHDGHMVEIWEPAHHSPGKMLIEGKAKS
jgi:hypothetical protein